MRAEILEARAKRIVSELGICEFILSSDIVSMALAMCAENPAVISILAVSGCMPSWRAIALFVPQCTGHACYRSAFLQ